jgi:DNA-binding transcriptional ArsR family regulator
MKSPLKPVPLAECEPKDHATRAATAGGASEDAFQRAADIFRALGDVSRLKLLACLAGGEWCVTELAQAIGASLPTVSQQLRVLRAEGLLSRRRVAKHVYYALADQHVRELIVSGLDHAVEPPPPPDDD